MSERQLSKSFCSIQEQICKRKQYYYWDFSTTIEKWLDKYNLPEQWLYSNLEWMTGKRIVSIQKSNENRLYYIVTTQQGEEHYLFLGHNLPESRDSLFLIYTNHYQKYDYNLYSHTLVFTLEEYDLYQNGIDSIAFCHEQKNNSVDVTAITVGGKIDLEFSMRHNLPFYKVLNDYHSILEEMSKYNLSSTISCDKSYFNDVTKIAIMFKKTMNKEIIGCNVIFDRLGKNKEWFDFDPNGFSMQAKISDTNHYAIAYRDGHIEWKKFVYDVVTYRIKDGIVFNCLPDRPFEKVKDQKLADMIVSDIREANELFSSALRIFHEN